jgi:CheY-like chemotaxis protein
MGLRGKAQTLMTDTSQVSGPDRASILVVDDDPMLLRMTQIVLTDLGYGVTPVADGRVALRTVDDAQGKFDLMILDMRMPDMDGLTVLERVHAAWPALKVLLVTGYAADGIIEATHAKGAVGVLEKPYDPDTLAATVQGLLRRA